MLLVFCMLVLIGALFAAGACWVGLIWLLQSERADPETAQALTVTQMLRRDLEARALWRSLSSWLGEKPLRLQDRSDRAAR